LADQGTRANRVRDNFLEILRAGACYSSSSLPRRVINVMITNAKIL